MPSSTALQGLPYPNGATDAPDGPAQLLALAQAVEKKAVMVFATASARSSAFTTAGVTPTEGMVCWLQDVNRYEYVNGSGAWTPFPGTRLASGSFATDLISGGTGAEVVGYSQAVPMVAGQRYMVTVVAFLNISVAGLAGLRVRYSTGTVTTASTAAEPALAQVLMAVGSGGRQTAHYEFEIVAPTTATYNVAVGALTVSGAGQLTVLGTVNPTLARVTAL